MARQSRPPILLLTRPQRQSERFAGAVQAACGPLTVVISPLMRTEYLHPAVPDRDWQAILLSSETAATAAGRLKSAGTALPALAFCVGDRTAEAAQKAGFHPLSARGDAVALMALVRGQGLDGPLLHIRGADTTGDMAQSLTNGGLETVAAIAYSQTAQPFLPDALALFALETPVLIPLFSPRSARLVQQAAPQDRRAPLWIAALSPAVAQAAEPLGAARLATAPHPDGENMLHTVAELLSFDGTA